MNMRIKTDRDTYLAKYAKPDTLDFRCPHCKAEPGQLCPGRPYGHAPRQNKMIQARLRWNTDAANHTINLVNKRRGNPYRHRTDHCERYMRRNGARIRYPEEPAATITFGAWLLTHTSRAMPLAYLGIRPHLRADMGVAEVRRLVNEHAEEDLTAYDVLDRATRDWAKLTQPERKGR